MKRGIAKGAVISMFKKGMQVKAKRKGPAEMLEAIRRKHPRQYDLPSLEEVSQLVAKLSQSGLPKPGGAGRRGGRTMEERFPTELGALRVEFDRRAEGDGRGMTAKDAVEWMTRRGGYASMGAWPAGGLTEQQVKRVVSRWRKQPAAAVRSADDGSDDEDEGALDWE